MPRGVAHPPELRAEAVAAVLAGGALAAVARRYGISKGTLGNWIAANQVGTVGTANARARDLGDLILELIEAHIDTPTTELRTVASPDYLERQPAEALAQLHQAHSGTLLRLLAGLQPVQEPEPALPPPSTPWDRVPDT